MKALLDEQTMKVVLAVDSSMHATLFAGKHQNKSNDIFLWPLIFLIPQLLLDTIGGCQNCVADAFTGIGSFGVARRGNGR